MSQAELEAISKAITEGDDAEAERLVRQALEHGLAPHDIMHGGIVGGITKAGELWKSNQYFLPDVILAADAFRAAMRPLEPLLKESRERSPQGKFVLGTVEGDMHNLGKSLVGALLTSAGFEVIDLGIDVPRAKFIEAVKVHQPAFLGLGAYMSTTMLQMKGIIAELEAQGLRRSLKVMVGGVPTSQEFADEVHADAWGKDALDAMQKALKLRGA